MNQLGLLSLLFATTLAASGFGQGLSIRKKTSAPVNIAFDSFDSLTFGTQGASVMKIHHGPTATMHDLVAIDSITFGPLPQYEIATSSSIGYDVRSEQATILRIGMATWGPNWGWMSLSGTEQVATNGLRTVLDTASVSNSTAQLFLTHTAQTTSQRTMRFTYDLRVDKALCKLFDHQQLTLGRWFFAHFLGPDDACLQFSEILRHNPLHPLPL